MDGHDADGKVRARADELYWSSDLSVNQIAEELDVSKGVLYEMIRPQPAAHACPECGEELSYPNRTARDRGRVACASCGWEGTEDDVEAYDAEAEPGSDDDEILAVERSTRTRVMVGGGLLGAAVGLALVLWARRR